MTILVHAGTTSTRLRKTAKSGDSVTPASSRTGGKQNKYCTHMCALLCNRSPSVFPLCSGNYYTVYGERYRGAWSRASGNSTPTTTAGGGAGGGGRTRAKREDAREGARRWIKIATVDGGRDGRASGCVPIGAKRTEGVCPGVEQLICRPWCGLTPAESAFGTAHSVGASAKKIKMRRRGLLRGRKKNDCGAG